MASFSSSSRPVRRLMRSTSVLFLQARGWAVEGGQQLGVRGGGGGGCCSCRAARAQFWIGLTEWISM